MSDSVNMTYAELAERLAIGRESARQLVIRKRWPRTKGNDGKARVSVPSDYLPPSVDPSAQPSVQPSVEPSADPSVHPSGATVALMVQVAELTTELRLLRTHMAALEADRDRWHAAFEQEQAKRPSPWRWPWSRAA